MAFSILLLFRIAFLASAIADGVQPSPSSARLPAGYHDVGEDRVAALERLCRATHETGLFTGAVLVADQGEVIYKAGFGLANREWNIPNTTDTKFRLASVSKQFCSALILQLVQEGKISLDDKITDHLSYYRKDTGNRITIHHLMAHQSGMRDFTASRDYRGSISKQTFGKDEFIRAHCSGELTHEPGTIYSYCNAGYCILGRIIERVTGMTYEKCLQERIFGPLGMSDSGFERNGAIINKRAAGYTRGPFGPENADFIEMDSTPGAAGAVYSTVEDMFRWDRSLYTDKMLVKQFRDLMFTPNRDVPEVKAAGGRPRSIYGYGWQIFTRTHPVTKRRTKVVNHGGAINGFRAIENRLVDDDAFVIVLCNQGDRFGENEVWNALTRFSTELIHVVTGQPYRMPSKARMTQDQRLYQLVKGDGVDAALEWFQVNGKPAAWGGTFMTLSKRLLDEGRISDGLRLMEWDVAQSPGKVWLLRATAQACLDHDRPTKALDYARRGLEKKPDDERLLGIERDSVERVGPVPADESEKNLPNSIGRNRGD